MATALDDEVDVAKKRKGDPEPKKEGWSAKELVFQMRGSPEFKAWLDELAEFDATDKSELAERAFAAYARQIGFAKPRPRR